MAQMYNAAYVKWRNDQGDDMPNAVFGPFAESKFLFL